MNNLIAINQILDNEQQITRLQRLAEIMATAQVTVPDGIRGNVGDCFMICVQAHVWNMSPFTVAQKTFTVKGKVGYEAQLISAVITRHALNDKPQFVYSDGWEKVLNKFTVNKNSGGKEYTVANWKPADEDGLYVDISATLVGENEPRTLRVFMTQAYPRQSSIWATDPRQQLAYTAIKKFARLHCPECILGVQDKDDLSAVAEKDVTPPKEKLAAILHGQSVAVRTESDLPPARSTVGQYIEDKQEPITREDIETTPHKLVDRLTAPDKGEAMKARVRQSMQDNHQSVEPAATEQDEKDCQLFLEVIANITDLKELKAFGEDIAGKVHPEFVNQVKDAYKQRRQELNNSH